MQATPKLSQPKTLVEGKRYLRREEVKSRQDPAFHTVVFISYCACPAFIVVRDEEGRKYGKKRLPFDGFRYGTRMPTLRPGSGQRSISAHGNAQPAIGGFLSKK